MTTTAVRPSYAAPLRDRDVMSQWVDIDPRHGGGQPRPADAHYVGVLRRIAAARIRYCGLGALTDEVMLLVSELVTNAVLHSGAKRIGLVMAVRDGFLEIAVVDGMPGVATLKEADEDAESGRGLALVETVVKEHGGTWGTSDAGAKTWCRLAVPEELER
ncbi:ATP-binding protein [Streptomyces sp. NPDC004629]|uniref:ATP-binding protein n=1 Tax=Streptomyces sp. NPDC004629 TaxID=3364705 RepID=UPI00367372B8